MAIQRVTSTKQIMQYMDGGLIEPAIQKGIRALQYGGEVGTKQARDHGSYQDQTGNLRGSTGYKVAHGGKMVSGSQFEAVRGGTKGPDEGRALAEDISRQLSSGDKTVLVQSAGMEYAAELEARGYDVLTSAEMAASQAIERRLSKSGFEKV